MNSTENINTDVLRRDVVLNTLLYLNFDVDDGASVEVAVRQLEYMRDHDQLTPDEVRQVNVIRAAIDDDPSIGRLIIMNQTSKMDEMNFEAGGIKACTFQDSATNPQNVTVAFMGTNSGEWVDNGIGLSGKVTSTQQQDQAEAYYNYVVEKNHWDVNKPDILHLTGHSKGGNKVQFIVMNSKYSDLITDANSIDGQSMSQEAMADMRRRLGDEEFERRRNKLYSFAAAEDYVNVLGVTFDGRLVPDDHIYYMGYTLLGYKWHYPDCLLKDDGTLTHFTEQGIISNYLEHLSKQVMTLPSPLRGIVTDGLMTALQVFMGRSYPVNGVWNDLNEWDITKKMFQSIPMVVVLLKTAWLDTQLDRIEGLLGFFGLDVELSWIATFMTGFYSIIAAVAGLALGVVVDIAHFLKDTIDSICEKIKGVVDGAVDFLKKCIDGLSTWFNKTFNKGYRYAEDHPEIKIDTAQMRNFASRLQAVNRRIVSVDRRLDNMYYRVGLLDLWNLMRADLLTGYSWRLDRCANYLNDTAEEFERVENELKGLLGG